MAGAGVEDLLRRVSPRPCLLAVAGLLLTLLDVRIGFFDLLPDAVGFAGVAYALTRPAVRALGPFGSTLAVWAARGRVAALVGLAATAPDLLSIGWTYHGRAPGSFWAVNTVGRFLALTATVALAVLLYALCRVVAAAAFATGTHELARLGARVAPWVPIPVAFDALIQFVVLLGGASAPEVIGALVQLGGYASFAVVVAALTWADQRVRTG